MYSLASCMAKFGTGTISIGVGKLTKEPDQWFIRIKEIKNVNEPKKIGEPLEKDDIAKDSQEIVLTFPSLEHMLKVYAAMGNKEYSQVLAKWNSIQEAKEWVEKSLIDGA